MATRDWPFHAGEIRAQERAGVRESIAPRARGVVRTHLPEQHRLFYQGLPFLVIAARDAEGRPWATLLTGRPGFARAPDRTSLLVDAALPRGDALEGALHPGSDAGVLGIDLATRRRNRVNGKVAESGPPLRLDVSQTFGNCPQYIHPRDWRWVVHDAGRTKASRSPGLSRRARTWIETADTLFIASGYRSGDGDNAFGMDASHRGGPAGFVEVASDNHLVLPDYAGNQYFNTIGNLVMDPRVGLLFVDFESGGLLQITGRARIDWNPGDVSRHPRAQRLVTVDIEEVVELREVLPLRWSAPGDAVRALQVMERIRETDDVTSFTLASRDGGPLPGFRAGQHLPIELRVPGYELPIQRTYSLSSAPGAGRYRISVKREPYGLASRYLHECVEPGDLLNAAAPAGDFVVASGDRQLALISAGIGITPMMSMLHEIAHAPEHRPTWFIHGARNGRQHAFAAEARFLAGGRLNIDMHVSYSRPAPDDLLGRDYDRPGRVDANLIESLLPGLNADFYLCGPAAFLSDLDRGLKRLGVSTERIHIEDFGRAATSCQDSASTE